MPRAKVLKSERASIPELKSSELQEGLESSALATTPGGQGSMTGVSCLLVDPRASSLRTVEICPKKLTKKPELGEKGIAAVEHFDLSAVNQRDVKVEVFFFSLCASQVPPD